MLGTEGSYRTGAYSGLVTGIGAAGQLWAVRWSPAATDVRKIAIVTRLRAKWETVAGFTAAQEVLLAFVKLTGFTVAHTVGTVLTPSKKRTIMPTAIMTGRIGITAVISGATFTADTDPFASGGFSELAAGAAVPKGAIDLEVQTNDIAQEPFQLVANEGILLRNEVAMGAGGTARVTVEMDWLELEQF